ncbi:MULTISPECIES: ribulokinase [unclassified Actinobaculum]|uniref:ribulokinase n=1 Tax=unclassified Actinobaculum TaxID=2609299 RepID=UPI000D529ED5|nr:MULTISPECIES: ribulokinase [unclassified Actinobaculum]AWE42343.1 ribulokinase [Actinobaculum sp. 313]RTE50917.1 ribulokinase [Actinobaculum sp. 352]
MSEQYVIGIDFGTLSGRATVVRVSDGKELGSAVREYPHGVMDERLTAADNRELPPDFALQVPSDYLTVLAHVVPAALREAHVDAAQVIGIGTDFTSATMIPTTADGTPLCQLPEFANEPHAYAKLWKHHGATEQAERCIAVARQREETWLARYGGRISSEFVIPKALETLEKAPAVYSAAAYYIEAVDWIVWQLCGRLIHCAASAGYKALFQDGRFPSRDYFAALNPDFADFISEKFDAPVLQLGERAGGLSAPMAALTGLPEGIAVAVGQIDAHVTAPAAQAIAPGQMTAIMGTSNVYIVNGETARDIPGVFGITAGGISAGLWGYEGGQSGVGDIFGWVVDNIVPADYRAQADHRGISVHTLLTEKAAGQAIGEHGLIALDWHNGNRSILNDGNLSGALIGMSLTTRAEDIYRAYLEATAFGLRVIIENFAAHGVRITEIVAAGGLLKNEFLMQLYADVTRIPLSISGSGLASSLGAAILGAVAAGAYPDVYQASAAMGTKVPHAYTPNEEAAAQYDRLYREYLELHDYFGRGGNPVMHSLKALQREVHHESLPEGDAV